MNTKPVFIQPEEGYFCRQITVDFVAAQQASVRHRTAEANGAEWLFYVNDTDTHNIFYVGQDRAIIKAVCYNKQHVLEIMMEESVCQPQQL